MVFISKMSFGLVILFAIAALTPGSEGVCNMCGAQSGVQCTGASSFTFCQGGAPTTQTGTCPSGTFCADTAAICTSTLPPDCTSGCGVCHPTRDYACITPTQFALCFGSTVPSATTGTCAAGTVCSTDAPLGDRCVTPSTTTPATCSTTSPTTAPPGAVDATATCRRVNTAGSFLVAGSGCKRYVRCWLSGGSFVGEQLTCPGTTLFNPVLQQCVNNYFCRF